MIYNDQPLDRTAFSFGDLGDDDAREFWRSQTPDQRLAALEFLRQVMYGYDALTDRIQRVLEFAELGGR